MLHIETHDHSECTVKSSDLTQALEAHRDATGRVHLGVRRLQKQASSGTTEVMTLSVYDAYRLGKYLVDSTPQPETSDPEATHFIPITNDSTVALVPDRKQVLPSANGSTGVEAGQDVLELMAMSQPTHDAGKDAITVRVSKTVWEKWRQYTRHHSAETPSLSQIVDNALRREMRGDREMSLEVMDAVERLRQALVHEIQSEAEAHGQ